MLIEFPRGDYKSVQIKITGFTGVIQQIYFTVKKKATDKVVLLQKKIGDGIEYSEETGKYILTFEPEDTDSMEMNKIYGCDFELFAENGKFKKTFQGQFHLTNEYTHKGDEL